MSEETGRIASFFSRQTLKNRTKVVAYLEIILLIILVWASVISIRDFKLHPDNYPSATQNTLGKLVIYFEIVVLGALIQFMSTFLMLYGVRRRKASLMFPWLFLSYASLLFALVMVCFIISLSSDWGAIISMAIYTLAGLLLKAGFIQTVNYYSILLNKLAKLDYTDVL